MMILGPEEGTFLWNWNYSSTNPFKWPEIEGIKISYNENGGLISKDERKWNWRKAITNWLEMQGLAKRAQNKQTKKNSWK